MNNRDYKKFAKGEYYHIYNRGVDKTDIFRDDTDYQNFIKRLKLILDFKEEKVLDVFNIEKKRSPWLRPLSVRALPKGSFSLISYCLMPNHFHILIKQNTDLPVTVLISKLCTSYSMYFNKKYQRVGSLFQDTFKAINVDDNSYLLWLSAYIHQNPAVAGLVWDLNEWKWSSYEEYRDEKGLFCDKSIILNQFKPSQYKKFVESSFDELKKKKLEISHILLD